MHSGTALFSISVIVVKVLMPHTAILKIFNLLASYCPRLNRWVKGENGQNLDALFIPERFLFVRLFSQSYSCFHSLLDEVMSFKDK